MAFGKQAYVRIAEVLEVPETASRNAFELCQRHGWVRRSTGSGKGAAHLYPFELLSITLAQAIEPRNMLGSILPALLMNAPMDMPQWFVVGPGGNLPGPDKQHVARWRGCCFGPAMITLDSYRDIVEPDLPKVLDQDKRLSGDGDVRCYRVLPGVTLGVALDGFIDFLGSHASKNDRSRLSSADFYLQIRSNNTAEIGLNEESFHFSTNYAPYDLQLTRQNMRRITTFSFEVFDALAELWADSRAHLGITSFPSSSGPVSPASDTPDTKTPPLPGRRLADRAHARPMDLLTHRDPTSQRDVGTRRVRGLPPLSGHAAGAHAP